MKKRSFVELLLTPKVPYLYGKRLDKVHMCYEDCDHFQPERLSEKTLNSVQELKNDI